MCIPEEGTRHAHGVARYDLFQLTGINGLSAAVGWRRSREDGQLQNIFGGEVVYGFRF